MLCLGNREGNHLSEQVLNHWVGELQLLCRNNKKFDDNMPWAILHFPADLAGK